jgi:hypothetical protein
MMTYFTRLAVIVPLLSAFTAASLSGALADDKKKPASTTQSKGITNTGAKNTAGDSKGAGQSGSPVDTVNNAVGGAVNNAVGGLLGAFGPK